MLDVGKILTFFCAKFLLFFSLIDPKSNFRSLGYLYSDRYDTYHFCNTSYLLGKLVKNYRPINCIGYYTFISNNKTHVIKRPVSKLFQTGINILNHSINNRPPDLSSLLLNERIVFIGLPIHPTIGQLVISQLLYLDFDSKDKPIKIYINTSDDTSDSDELFTSEIDALNIVDVIKYIKTDIITVNLGKAYGPSAVILASGTRGKRFVLPRSFTSLRQSSFTLPFRQAEDIAIYSDEILRARKNIIKVISRACNKTEEEVFKKLKSCEYMDAKETVDYGLADKIIEDTI